MKIFKTLTYCLMVAGTTTICLSGLNDRSCQPFAAFAKTPLVEPPQGIADTPQPCQTMPSGSLWARTELFFGLSWPNGTEISQREFQAFFDREVVSRFPAGSTILAGQGQFKNAKGTSVREPARLLILFYPIEKDNRRNQSNQSIEMIRKAYKTIFQQESVLRSDALSCVSF